MFVLRGTRKVLRLLPQSAGDGDASDTALGDWYVNRTVVDRQPLLLCVSAKSLLALVARARDVKRLPDYFPGLVADRLRRLGADMAVINSEMDAMTTVRVGPTRDRSVTGTMVDFAKALPYYLRENGWDEQDLQIAEGRFAKSPCRCGRSQPTIWPHDETLRLLEERWRS